MCIASIYGPRRELAGDSGVAADRYPRSEQVASAKPPRSPIRGGHVGAIQRVTRQYTPTRCGTQVSQIECRQVRTATKRDAVVLVSDTFRSIGRRFDPSRAYQESEYDSRWPALSYRRARWLSSLSGSSMPW